MRKSIFIPFMFAALYFAGFSSLPAQNKNPLDEANDLYAGKKYSEAAEIYRRLLGEAADADERARITYSLGMTYRQMKNLREADEQFRRTLLIDVSNRPVRQGIVNTYENYHHNAQFEIAKIQFESGNYEAALKSFENAGKKYPFKSDCGSCIRDENYKITLYQAATLEYLNRNKEAFGAYFKIAHPRLIEIYAANNRIEKFIEYVEKKDEPLIGEYMRKYSHTREQAKSFLPTKDYREFFRIYELKKAGNADALMTELRKLASSPQDSYLKDWAAKMLAENPASAIALVSAELKNLKTYPYVFYRTLGFAATPEAVALLKSLAEKSAGWYDAESVAASLMLAGEKGADVLRELEAKNSSKNTRLAVEKYKNGELAARNYEEMSFAPLVKTEFPPDF